MVALWRRASGENMDLFAVGAAPDRVRRVGSWHKGHNAPGVGLASCALVNGRLAGSAGRSSGAITPPPARLSQPRTQSVEVTTRRSTATNDDREAGQDS